MEHVPISSGSSQSTGLPASVTSGGGTNVAANLLAAVSSASPAFDALMQNLPPQQVLQFLQQAAAAAGATPAANVVHHAAQHQQQQSVTTALPASAAAGVHNLSAFHHQLIAQQQQHQQQQQQHAATVAALALQQQQQQLASSAQQLQQQISANGQALISQHHHQQQQQNLHQQLAAVAAAGLQQQQHHQQQRQSTPEQQFQQHAQQQSQQQQQPQSQQQPAGSTLAALNAGTTVPSLAWPIFQPAVTVPYFDMETYNTVDLDVQPSKQQNGSDLPLTDINTLRFFFNFGVQHARHILLHQHVQSQAGHMTQTQQQMLLLHANQNAIIQTATQNEQLQLQQALLNTTPSAIASALPKVTIGISGNAASGSTPVPHNTASVAAALAAVLTNGGMQGSSAASGDNSLHTALQTAAKLNGISPTVVASANEVTAFKPLVPSASSSKIGFTISNSQHNSANNNNNGSGRSVSSESSATPSATGGSCANDKLDACLQQLLSSGALAGANNAQLQAIAALAQQTQNGAVPASAAAAFQQLLLNQQQKQQQQQKNNHSIEVIRPQAINPLISGQTNTGTTLQQQQLLLHHLQQQQLQQSSSNENLASGGGNSSVLSVTGGSAGTAVSTALFSTSTSHSATATPNHMTSASRALMMPQITANGALLSPKPPIPVDPAPRKVSDDVLLKTKYIELKQECLRSVRSVDYMSDNLTQQVLNTLDEIRSTFEDKGGKCSLVQPIGATTPQHSKPGATMQTAVAPSLAAQLSVAMVAGVSHSSLGPSMLNVTTTNASTAIAASGGGSITTTSVTRSLTSGTSGLIGTCSSVIGPPPQTLINVGALMPEEAIGEPSFLDSAESHYTLAFKRDGSLAGLDKKISVTASTGAAQNVSPSAVDGQRRKSGVYMLNMDSKEDVNADAKKRTSHLAVSPATFFANKASLAPAVNDRMNKVSTTLMVNYMNNVLTSCKAQIQSQGVGLYFDDTGKPIDFSSRPIDAIFRNARENDTNRLSLIGDNNNSDSESHDINAAANVDASNRSASGGPSCLIGISESRLKGISTLGANLHDQLQRQRFSPATVRSTPSSLTRASASPLGGIAKSGSNNTSRIGSSPQNLLASITSGSSPSSAGVKTNGINGSDTTEPLIATVVKDILPMTNGVESAVLSNGRSLHDASAAMAAGRLVDSAGASPRQPMDDDGELSSPSSKRLRIASFSSSGDEADAN